jgi:O-antigen/teichoic acid export membrane protein
LINAGFLVLLGILNLSRMMIVAAFVSRAEFGVWSIIFLAIGLLAAMKTVAVSDKFVQQEESDQEVAFQKAFTLELITGTALMLAMIVLTPVLAVVYDESSLLLPGFAISLMMLGSSLQAPTWIFYRRMDFFRQRLLIGVEPVVALLVTVALAVAGAGYWSLVIGALAGAWAGGLVAVAASPYRLALRYDHGTMRQYVSFSWPLVAAVAAGLGIAQLSVFFGNLALGLAGAGAIGLAATFSGFTDKVDDVITQTIYPGICRVRERRELLLEAFVKSNRLALMWGVPFGVALTLFASDLIDFGIGRQWAPALVLFQVFGVQAAISHIGFNWSAFYRASGDTRPIAVVTVIAFVAFCASAIPLLLIYGLNGFAAGVALMVLVALVARWYYISRLFPGFEVAGYMLRAIIPTVPAAAAVLGVRVTLESGERTLGVALGELALYLAITAVATVAFERPLLAEALSYLRRAPSGGLQGA